MAKPVTLPVTDPETLPVTLPCTFPVTVPDTFPVTLPENPPAVITPVLAKTVTPLTIDWPIPTVTWAEVVGTTVIAWAVAAEATLTWVLPEVIAIPTTLPVTLPETPPVTDPDTEPVTLPDTVPVTLPETVPVTFPENPPAEITPVLAKTVTPLTIDWPIPTVTWAEVVGTTVIEWAVAAEAMLTWVLPAVIAIPTTFPVRLPETLPRIAELNVFAPAIVWVPVVMTPLAVALASGKLNVWVDVAEEIAKSVPVVPVWKDWDAAVRVLRVVIPPAGAPVWSSSQDNVTTPPEGADADKTCPAVGVSIGRV